jgi:hypothetical protein
MVTKFFGSLRISKATDKKVLMWPVMPLSLVMPTNPNNGTIIRTPIPPRRDWKSISKRAKMAFLPAISRIVCKNSFISIESERMM